MKNMLKKLIFLGVVTFGIFASISLNSITYNRSKGSSEAVTLQRCDGYVVRFKANPNATKYVINDEADYRNGLVLTNADADSNGYIYFEAETVGTHNISVTSYVNDNPYESTNGLEVTVKPVFYYSEQSNLYFYDIDNESDTSTYSILQKDGSWLKVSRTEYDSNQIHNLGNAIDFSAPEYVYETLNAQKQAGANVLYLGSRTSAIERNSYWWFPGTFEESVCKRYMDAAWSLGMKCIITDYVIQTVEEQGDLTTISERLNNTHLRQAFLHPAFYGLQFEDEPAQDEIANVGKSAKYIIDFWRNDPELSQKDDPIIYTALRSYDENKSETFGYFENKDAYKAYIRSWFDETGLDYVVFDTYTYTTRTYGTKKKWGLVGETLYYDPSKVIYDSFNEVISELGGDKEVFQVITGSTDTSRKASVTSTDVFASMLLAAAQDVSGYSVFTFKENNYSKSSMLNLNQQFTNTYYYHQEANKQYEKIQSILEGYKATSKSISSYGSSYYGPGVRTVNSTFTNTLDNTKTYNFIANFESAADDTTYEVTVPNNKIYYLFGYGVDTYQRVGTNNTVTLHNGQAILISNQDALTVADTSFDKSLLEDYDVITISDFARTNEINNTDEIHENPGATPEISTYDAYRSDSGSVALRFNYRADKLGTDWSDGVVDISLNEHWGSNSFSVGAFSGDVCIKVGGAVVEHAVNVLKENADNIVEVGAVKIKNSNNTYLYITVNDGLVCETTVDNYSFNNYVMTYIAAGNAAGTNVRLSSVPLNRANNYSGKISNISGNSSTINFNIPNEDKLDYNNANGTVRTYTYKGNTLTKTDYKTFTLNLANPVSVGESVNIAGTYTYYDSTKDELVSFTIEDTNLYYTGSSYIVGGHIQDVTSSMKLAYRFKTDTHGNILEERFVMRFAISNAFSDEISSLGEYGIKVSTSSKVKYYPIAETHLDPNSFERYVIIDLGKAISENHYNDVFTCQAYLYQEGTYILSNEATSYSIYSLVCEMYNDASTKAQVTALYNYLNR